MLLFCHLFCFVHIFSSIPPIAYFYKKSFFPSLFGLYLNSERSLNIQIGQKNKRFPSSLFSILKTFPCRHHMHRNSLSSKPPQNNRVIFCDDSRHRCKNPPSCRVDIWQPRPASHSFGL